MRLGVEKMKTSRNSKHVLVVISDGADNQSKTSFNEVRDLLRTSDVVLYCVGLLSVAAIDNVNVVKLKVTANRPDATGQTEKLITRTRQGYYR